MKTIVRKQPNYFKASAAEIAADIKARGIGRDAAWSEYVKLRALRPDISAKEFLELFNNVAPASLVKTEQVDFEPTHIDTFLDLLCRITERKDGVFEIIWSNGMTGTNPPTYPPEESRFLPYREGAE